MVSKLPYSFREVMSSRNIQDLKLKMLAIKRARQEDLDELFLDMCDSGRNQYIASIQAEFPEKTATQIMKEYFLHHMDRE